MNKLIVTDNYGATTELDLNKLRLNIGRHPDNDLVLNDDAVSSRHAAIVTLGKSLFLDDLESTNGTIVNGRSVTRHPLVHGDVITMGLSTMRFVGRSADVPVTAEGKQPLARLRVLNGPSKGQELELIKAVTTVGKRGVQVGAITRRADGYYIAHVGSEEEPSPLLNGVEIMSQTRRLSSHDRIELAGTQMEFALQD